MDSHRGHRNKRSERDRSPEVRSLPRRSRRDSPADTKRRAVRTLSWDGSLGEEEDVAFNLAFEWNSFKSVLCRMVFGRGGWLNSEPGLQDEFWTFFGRLLTKIAHQARAEGKNAEYTVIQPLRKLHARPKNFNTVHRYRFVRGDDEESPELPDSALKCFHYAVLCYLDFLEKQEIQKLRKLRQGQSSLPISNYQNRILELLQSNSLVIVSGDTGCGKSTQVPQYLLKAGFDKICCTQPRRIACISLSKRVAFETLNEYGSQVAYQIRFEKTRTSHTRIVFMTEGLLLRQMGGDPLLSQYSVLVLDEVHERHLHSDFLLGVVRCLIEQRLDLKIVLMSATINIQLFANYFNSAPVVQVPGRLYPIQLMYTPISSEFRSKSSRLNPMPYVRVLQMIDNKYPTAERGDVLIFLSGINEITTVAEAAAEYAQKNRKWIILQLHSSLSLAEQDKVFDIAPEGVRKCVIGTNIAETSITIDGIRFVVDSGRVKEMSFDPKYHMQRLQEFWVSQASAEQRRGRAGRTGPGVCYRMYQQSDYDEFASYSTPEIQRVPLDSLILQMIAMGLPEVRKFPFIEPPSDTAVEQSLANLKSHGALTFEETLTPVGKTLAKLPLDVMIGKILISGTLLYSLMEPVLFITAALSVQNPFTNNAFRDLDVRKLLEPLFSDHGDAITLLKVFHGWLEEKKRASDYRDGSRRWCRKRGIEEQRLYEITKLCGQFREILQEHGLLNVKKMAEELQAERGQRKGQIRQLRFLKRVAQRSKKTRKVLSLDEDTAASDVEKDDGEVDVQQVEFQLQNDQSNVDDMFQASGNLSEHEIRILKLILCSGLYPNIAIADECNSYKVGQDQIFHTRSKPYVVLHPTSVFALQPDVLVMKASDVPVADGTGKPIGREIYSEYHQLLVYVALMETNKPYLMNCLRIPALHSLLLFAGSVDTNGDCTRLVFDGWIDVRIRGPRDAQIFIEMAMWVRVLWQKLLDSRLTESQVGALEYGQKSGGIASLLEKDLIGKLTDYVAQPVLFAVQRLLAADMKNLYVGNSAEYSTAKGGEKISNYFTYNCLTDAGMPDRNCDWICPKCDEQFSGTVYDRLGHFSQCIQSERVYDDFKASVKEEVPNSNPLAKPYDCADCGKTLHLTPAEVLKHRRSHMAQIRNITY